MLFVMRAFRSDPIILLRTLSWIIDLFSRRILVFYQFVCDPLRLLNILTVFSKFE